MIRVEEVFILGNGVICIEGAFYRILNTDEILAEMNKLQFCSQLTLEVEIPNDEPPI